MVLGWLIEIQVQNHYIIYLLLSREHSRNHSCRTGSWKCSTSASTSIAFAATSICSTTTATSIAFTATSIAFTVSSIVSTISSMGTPISRSKAIGIPEEWPETPPWAPKQWRPSKQPIAEERPITKEGLWIVDFVFCFWNISPTFSPGKECSNDKNKNKGCLSNSLHCSTVLLITGIGSFIKTLTVIWSHGSYMGFGEACKFPNYQKRRM